ncbi:hypothetical protein WICPIJ_000270 [Wickerhamomyces pijperi]|uniref:Uncharacterized protein n=1 Tax=Wickerhamomyces pijperi TaxID=599730 RepID=A0A9P8QD65_WICPI|nr:hypothetical protein WICPIJ_000270 [Wickerhamomyces pijperi]
MLVELEDFTVEEEETTVEDESLLVESTCVVALELLEEDAKDTPDEVEDKQGVEDLVSAVDEERTSKELELDLISLEVVCADDEEEEDDEDREMETTFSWLEVVTVEEDSDDGCETTEEAGFKVVKLLETEFLAEEEEVEVEAGVEAGWETVLETLVVPVEETAGREVEV